MGLTTLLGTSHRSAARCFFSALFASVLFCVARANDTPDSGPAPAASTSLTNSVSDGPFGSACSYPQSALVAHNEGTAFVSYRGTDDGHIEDVTLVSSSGHSDLDDATMQCVSRWRFDPSKTADRFYIGPHRAGISWAIPQTGGQAVGRFIGLPHSCASYYPEAEMKAGVEGTAHIGFTVTERGEVRDPVVLQSSGNKNLDDTALRCVRYWSYKPAEKDGEPIAVSWQVDIVWKLEAPQPPPLAEPHQDCAHSRPVRTEDLSGIDGTTEVTFEIVRGDVYDVSVAHRSGNAALDRAAVECVRGRKYVREMITVNGIQVDKHRSLTLRERIVWADALKPVPMERRTAP